MKDYDFLAEDDDPELYELVKAHQNMRKTGESADFDEFDLLDLAHFYVQEPDMDSLEHVVHLCEDQFPYSDEMLFYKTCLLVNKGLREEASVCLNILKEFAEELFFEMQEETEEEESNENEEGEKFYNGWDEAAANIKIVEGMMAMADNDAEMADQCFLEAYEKALNGMYKSFVITLACNEFMRIETQTKYIKQWMRRYIDVLSMVENPAAYGFLSAFYCNKRDLVRAEIYMDKLVDRDPYSTDSWNFVGDVYLDNHFYDKAIDAYDFVLAIDKNDTDALKKKAFSFFRLENFEKAMELYARYNKIVPDDYFSQTLQALCMLLLKHEKEAFELIENVKKAITDRKDISDIEELYYFATRVCRIGNKFNEALEWAELALSLGLDRMKFSIIKGSILLEWGRHAEAEKILNDAIEQSQDKTFAKYLVATELMACECYSSATKLFLDVYLSLDMGRFPTTVPLLAYCNFQINEFNKYLFYLKEACRDFPDETRQMFLDVIPKDMSLEDFYASEEQKYRDKIK